MLKVINGKASLIAVLIGRLPLAIYLKNGSHKIKGICKCWGDLFLGGNPSAEVILLTQNVKTLLKFPFSVFKSLHEK